MLMPSNCSVVLAIVLYPNPATCSADFFWGTHWVEVFNLGACLICYSLLKSLQSFAWISNTRQ